MKRVVILIVIIALGAAGWYAFRRYQQQQAAEALSSLQTVAAERGSLTASVGATGVVRANQSALLPWQTTGRVETVEVAEGDPVEPGQVLAVLDFSSLAQNVILARSDLINAGQALEDLQPTSLALEQARQAVREAEAAVIEAERALAVFSEKDYENDLENAEEEVEATSEELERANNDLEAYQDEDPENALRQYFEDRQDLAQREYEAALRDLNELKLQPQQARANVEVAKAHLSDTTSQLEDLENGPDPDERAALEARIEAAEATLSLARLEAPFSGTVTAVDLKPGDLIAPGGAPAFRLDDLSRLLVDVQVSEVDINRVRQGQEARLTFDAIPGREYRGRVTEIARVGTNVQGVVEFTVTVELLNADEAVRPGMTAAVNIVVDQLEDVLLVPNRAVRVNEGQRVVYILRNNSPEPVDIELGASSETVSEVVGGGLQEGDPIVLNPPVQLDGGGGPGFLR
jgi:HlyD family secretion protein